MLSEIEFEEMAFRSAFTPRHLYSCDASRPTLQSMRLVAVTRVDRQSQEKCVQRRATWPKD